MLGIAINIWPSRYPRRESPSAEPMAEPSEEPAFMLFLAAFMTGNVTSSPENGNARTPFGHEEFNGHCDPCRLDDHSWLRRYCDNVSPQRRGYLPSPRRRLLRWSLLLLPY